MPAAKSRKSAKLPSGTYLRNETIWGRVKIAGVQYRASLRTADSSEAKIRYEAWRKGLERSAMSVPDCPTLNRAAVRWITEVLPGSVRPGSAKRYIVSIGQIVKTMGTLPVDRITIKTISGYISARSGKATNATIRRDITALSRLLSSCVMWGYRDGNPARDYDRSVIRERRDPIQPPDSYSVDTIINAAPAGMADALRLLAATGMREMEAAGLDARDIDVTGQTITLTRTKTNRPRVLDWETPGGNATPVLSNAPSRGFLFLNVSGVEYKNFASNVSQLMRRIIVSEKKAGTNFRRFRVHDLRHGFAIRWLQNGGNIYKLSRHLGHSSVKTTEIYLSYLTAEQERIAKS